jgi:hypothetical protein
MGESVAPNQMLLKYPYKAKQAFAKLQMPVL